MSLVLSSQFKDVHIDCIWCVKFHPAFQLFASCGSDCNIIIWEYDPTISNYKKSSILAKTHKSTIRNLDWDYSGKFLSAASFDNTISIWKITNALPPYQFTCLTTLDSGDSEIKSVSWSISGNYIACCSRKGNIWIWEKDEDEFQEEEFTCKSTFQGHKGDIKMVKFSPREDILFSCSFDESIKIWELDISKDDFNSINELKYHTGTVWFIEFNKNGDKFFTCSDDKSVVMWGINFEGEKPYENINRLFVIDELHRWCIYSCCLDVEEKYLYTASEDGDIGIIEIEGNKMKLVNKIKEAHGQQGVNCINVNKNQNEIVTCGDDCSIKIWNFQK